MKVKPILLMLAILLLSSIVVAVDVTTVYNPHGGHLQYVRSANWSAFANITVNSSDFSNSSQFWRNLGVPTEITQVGILTELSVTGPVNFTQGLNSTNVVNTPAACAAGAMIRYLGATSTCADLWVELAGDDVTGNFTFGGNSGVLNLSFLTVSGLLSVDLLNSSSANVSSDLLCVDCLNANEIEDIYLSNNADEELNGNLSIIGNLSVSSVLWASQYYASETNEIFNFYSGTTGTGESHITLNFSTDRFRFMGGQGDLTRLILVENVSNGDTKIMRLARVGAGDNELFVVSVEGDDLASYFTRSLVIGGNQSNMTYLCPNVDFRTNTTGADLCVEDDIDLLGTIFGGGNSWNITDDGSISTSGNLTADTINLMANTSFKPCAAGNAGDTYFDGGLAQHLGCNGTVWRAMYS